LTFFCAPIGRLAKAADDAGPKDRRSAIEVEADKLAPDIAAAVRRALAEQLDDVDMAALESAVNAGDEAEVMAVVGAISGPRAAVVADLLEGAMVAGAALEAASPVLNRAEFTFDPGNPAATAWVNRYAYDLIREIDAGTREAVRAALAEGMKAGKGASATAVSVREAVGLTERQSKAVANYRRELETMHLKRSAQGWKLGGEIDRRNGRQIFRPGEDGRPKDGIDQRRLRDFRYDGATQRALESRKPLKPEQIERMVAAYQRKYLKFRAETIARTESIRALAAGANEAWRQAIASGQINGNLVRKIWRVSPDERLCKICKDIPAMNPRRGVRIDAPFKTTLGPMFLPPAHPNCRCSPVYRLWEPQQLANGA
jgi:hypothetical protein